MKKIISTFLAAMMIILTMGVSASAAEEGQLEIKSKSAILMDASTGQVLYKMNEHQQLFPASVTKIMPMLLFMETLDSGKIKLDDKVSTSPTAASKGGSQIWLKEGETMTVDEMIKATAVSSANDACTALGEHIAGSEEAFINMMNERAQELGMKNTHFDNATGLDDATDTHLTTAYDIALMARELMKHEKIKDYTTIWMDSLRGGETELVNTNKLIRFYPGATGLKTGTTSKAGHCLCATAERAGTKMIAVVMGSENSDDRFAGAKTLLNHGFANWETTFPEPDKSLITSVRVLNGEKREIMPEISSLSSFLIPKGKAGDLKQDITLTIDVEAPIEKGQVLGKVSVSLNGEELGSYNLTAPQTIQRLNFSTMLKRMISAFGK